MYFNAETQSRIPSRFHFAIGEHGLLFLGKAETLLSHTGLFAPVDLKRRVFRKVPHQPVPNPSFHMEPPVQPARADLVDLDHLRNETFLASPVAPIVVTTDGRSR
jgi:two-component system, chemotaxis family, CheB/CheR fusion protein